jgi:hypothetical protein
MSRYRCSGIDVQR